MNNPRSEVERKTEFRKTLVKRGATLGANCTIVCGVIIGKFAFIGAGSVVGKDVPPYALMVGVPAKQVGWMSEYGEKLNLPVEGADNLHSSNQIYQVKDGKVTILDKNEIDFANLQAQYQIIKKSIIIN